MRYTLDWNFMHFPSRDRFVSETPMLAHTLVELLSINTEYRSILQLIHTSYRLICNLSTYRRSVSTLLRSCEYLISYVDITSLTLALHICRSPFPDRCLFCPRSCPCKNKKIKKNKETTHTPSRVCA